MRTRGPLAPGTHSPSSNRRRECSNARWTVRPQRSRARDRGTACDQSKRASWTCPSPYSVRKLPTNSGKCRTTQSASPHREPASRVETGAHPAYRRLLAMQKVEGSNPISRSQKACICRPFLRAQSACASVSGRTDSGLAAGRSSAVPRKTPCLQDDSGSSEPKSLLRACRRSGVRPATAVTPTPAATARPCGLRPPARYQRSRSLGASPVSVRKPGGQPRLAPRPRLAQVVNRPPGRHGCRLAQARAGTRLSRSLVRSAR